MFILYLLERGFLITLVFFLLLLPDLMIQFGERLVKYLCFLDESYDYVC